MVGVLIGLAMDTGTELFLAFSSKRDAIADTQPTHLSHYCDLAALQSILSKNKLWASNIRFLNDKEEMDFGLSIAKDVMMELLEKRSKKEAILADRRRWVFRDIPDVYAVCFCERPDQLSQWRGYGLARQSVSIQFDRSELVTVGFLNNFRLTKVIYGKQAAMEVLKTNLNAAPNIVDAIVANRSIDTEEEQRQSIMHLSPQFKNPSFDEEEEWRLISYNSTPTPEFRPKDNVLLPYLQVGYDLQTPLPITQITVGPGKDSALTKRSIEHFLKTLPRYADVPVTTSKIPFRI